MTKETLEPDLYVVPAEKATEHEVNGRTLKFYPISFGMVFKLKKFSDMLAAIRTLFTSHATDVGQTERQFNGEGATRSGERIIAPISVELAKLREANASAAVKTIIETVTDEKNATILGEIIMDSLREDFPRETRDAKKAEAFVKSMDLEVLSAMLIGLARANRKVLGPFGDLLEQNLSRAVEKVTQLVSVLQTSGLEGAEAEITKMPQPTPEPAK